MGRLAALLPGLAAGGRAAGVQAAGGARSEPVHWGMP